MQDDWSQIGDGLVEYARNEAEFTAQRSVIDELFPYIYVASRRMSLRAISRWLLEAQGIKLSVVAIARAMRNIEEHWRELVEAVEPAARVFGQAHGVEAKDVLLDEGRFFDMETMQPMLSGDDDTVRREYLEYSAATATLRHRWFEYPEEVRTECRRHVGWFNLSELKEE